MDSSIELTRTSSENTPLLRDSLAEPVNENVKKFSRQSIFTCAIVCILFTELCERLTFYGINGNLFLFATEDEHLEMTPYEASILVLMFQGIDVIMSSHLRCLCERHFTHYYDRSPPPSSSPSSSVNIIISIIILIIASIIITTTIIIMMEGGGHAFYVLVK